ncbi:MAG: sugar ABC transporter substrate-binding protein [Gemmatimonadota bacterium]
MRALAALARLLLGCGTALAFGCGAADDGVEVVEFWGFGREGEVVGELVPEFERENPGVRVEVQQVPWTAAHEKLLTAFVGEATPDVAQLGNTWVPEFVALGALERLDPWIGRSTVVAPGAYFEGIWQTNVVEGGTYGIPWYADTRVLFYRTDLLEEAGYRDPPETWAEWLDAMARLRQRMGEREWPILLPTNEWPQPVILGLQNGSQLLRDDGRRGAFRQKPFREAFEFYVGLFRRGYAPAIANTQLANLYQQFERGEFAMVITGPWNIGEFRRRLSANVPWTTAPLPGPDSLGVSMAGGSSLVIFADSESKNGAWRLIEYLSRPEVQLRFYDLMGDLPARVEAWEAPALAGDPQARAFHEQLRRVTPLPQVPEWERIATRVYERGEAAVRGSMTVDQTLTALDRDVDRMLAKRRWMLAQREEEEAVR